MGKTFTQSPKAMTLAAVLGAAMIATSATAQPPENHGQSPHGGQAPAHNGGGGQGQHPGGGAPAGAPGGGAPGGMRPGGGAPAAQQPHPQAPPAQQAAPRPQQNFGGNGGRPGQPDGHGGQQGGQFGGQRGPGFNDGGQRRPEGPGGPGFNGNGGREPNWGPGANGQPHYNPGPQHQAFDEHRGPGGPGGNYRAWNNGWRGDNRYDWRGWRDSHRDSFHLSPYFAPYRGYSYRRLSLGFVMDPLFFGNSYTIYDPGAYRLPPAYAPYRWVRYYNDAVLVDTYTGQVVDVLYSFFW